MMLNRSPLVVLPLSLYAFPFSLAPLHFIPGSISLCVCITRKFYLIQVNFFFLFWMAGSKFQNALQIYGFSDFMRSGTFHLLFYHWFWLLWLNVEIHSHIFLLLFFTTFALNMLCNGCLLHHKNPIQLFSRFIIFFNIL